MLFALAYGNETLIDKISESTDNIIKQITNAMNSSAPKIALIQLRIKNESLHSYDLSEISNAVATIKGIRNNPKMTVELWLVQDNLQVFDAHSEEHREIVKFIDAHKNSGAYLIDFLNGIANEIERQGSLKLEYVYKLKNPKKYGIKVNE